ncbi:MAG: TIGR04283 family arsenosugar biosynthesis glycosyltransferase [Owenweeksia sp.]|nr:TIGR04283 family arsenosugar biosynthesis glycosyltransferase [Owenweeksia sp.]
MNPWLSIIIPSYNEEAQIRPLLEKLTQICESVPHEILVSDAGSIDATASQVNLTSAQYLKAPVKGRAAQMNHASQRAKGEWLFFLHADCQPPINFIEDLKDVVERGYDAACFRLEFKTTNLFLKANAWFTRFNVNAFRFGDQGLLVSRSFFEKAGGYNPEHIVLEDQDFVTRLRKMGAKFRVMPNYMLTSARKYKENGPLRLQLIFLIIWIKYRLGYSQPALVQFYKSRMQ